MRAHASDGSANTAEELTGALVTALGAPESIAIIGASDDPAKLSGRPIANLRRCGYAGRILPINSRRATVQGLPAYASLDAAPGPVHVAIIALPQPAVPDALRACAKAGVPLAIIFASGFAEVGGDGVAAQEEIARIAGETGIRVLGPNTIGAAALATGAAATFTTAFDDASQDIVPGSVALVSQSGALGAYMMNSAMRSGVGVGHFVHTGNEADLTVAEIIGLLAADVGVNVVLTYLEGVRDPETLAAAARTARAHDTPIVAMKVGRSAAGARAAVSHTGALTGADDVADAALRRLGIPRVEGLKELVDAGRIFAAGRRTRGDRLSVLGVSGGAGILISDLCADHGVAMTPWEPEWRAKMAAVIPSYGSAVNPIDVTASMVSDTGLFADALDITVDHPGTDMVMVFVGNAESCEDEFIATVDAAYRRTDKPIIVVWTGGNDRALKRLAGLGIPAFDDPGRAVRAVSLLVRYAEMRGRPIDPPAGAAPEGASRTARELIAAARAEGHLRLDEVAGKRLLAAYGIPAVEERAVDTPEEAVAAAGELGFPVAVKALSPALAHKTELGCVRLGLGDADAVAAGAREVLAAASAGGVAGARLVVQRMVSGLELVAGVGVDPVFGPQVVVGLGGVLVEVLRDRALAPAPFGVDEARRMLGSLRAAAMLDGVRGGAARDTGAVADLLARLSVLAADLADEIAEIDANPVMVGAEGDGAVVADALVVLRDR
ncbi:MAG TPA: acetate--CoA ligase family protein [Streptosporangiaceae bacterium]|jgi:acyl-CoA synthetase (NDP forming)